MTTVGELGEVGVLARILAKLGDSDAAQLGPGDDCAVLAYNGDGVVTTDTMIEGPDFRLAWHSGYSLGWKLAVTNLSDVAAMGARPTALTVALACPPDTPVELLEDIARGLTAACEALAPGCGVVGGDLGRAPVLFAAITALGELEGRAPVTRSGAQPGDTIAYAGDLGLSGMGLALLFRECADEQGVALSDGVAALTEERPAPVVAQLAPRSPIHLGASAARAAATAMLDVSDGLSLDASRIARASGVRVNLDAAALTAGFGEQRGEHVSIEAMLFGGEDHGLLATFPAGAELPDGFVRIGEVSALDSDGVLLSLDGEAVVPRGWDPYLA